MFHLESGAGCNQEVVRKPVNEGESGRSVQRLTIGETLGDGVIIEGGIQEKLETPLPGGGGGFPEPGLAQGETGNAEVLLGASGGGDAHEERGEHIPGFGLDSTGKVCEQVGIRPIPRGQSSPFAPVMGSCPHPKARPDLCPHAERLHSIVAFEVRESQPIGGMNRVERL